MSDVKHMFTVNGKPFFPVGGQSCNSSGYNDSESEKAFKVVKQLQGNTLEIPVYWEQLEPKEGQFDFTAVDALLCHARHYGLKLIILWFATWKNGNMDYTPEWVKTNSERFKRVVDASGSELWVLSSHCAANLEADKKAYVALCKHLKDKDCIEQTVIGIQVENEPGIIGSERDYGAKGQTIFDGSVPARLLFSMKVAGKGRVYDIWQKAGGKKSGSWTELFDGEAGELMSAWSIASYIDRVAEAGKAVYNIPMFINVWLTEYRLWSLPGTSYPCGGGIDKVLDIYKWFTSHVDFIGPDIYIRDSKSFEYTCSTYSRDDNPFFLPESLHEVTESYQPRGIFRAIADYNLIGYFFFGVEYIAGVDGSFHPEFSVLTDNVKCISAVSPLLLKYQGTGKIHAVIQEEKYMKSQEFDFDGYLGLVQFGEEPVPRVHKDWRHSTGEILFNKQSLEGNPGRGLIIQASRNEFYLVGANYRLLLRPKQSHDKPQAPLSIPDMMLTLLSPYLSVDEGHFDQNGEYVIARRRNGGQVFSGIWIEPDCGVVRVIMSELEKKNKNS